MSLEFPVSKRNRPKKPALDVTSGMSAYQVGDATSWEVSGEPQYRRMAISGCPLPVER